MEPSALKGIHAAQLELLSLILEWFGEYKDSNAFLQRLYDELPRRLEVDRASILLYDPGEKALVSGQLIGLRHLPEDVVSAPQPIGYSVSGLCFSEARPIVVNDCRHTDLIPAEWVEHLRLKSCVAVPLLGKGGPVGVLRVDHTQKVTPFANADIEFLTTLGRQIGLLVENVRLSGERDHAYESLRAAQARYAQLISGESQGMWDWNIRTDTIHYSGTWAELIGAENEGLRPTPSEWFRRVHPDDLNRLKADINAHLNGQLPVLQNEHRILHGSGKYRWVLVRGEAIRDESGAPIRMAGTLTEITDQRNQEKELVHAAFYDDLTGLPNRALFLDHLRRCVEHSRRRPQYQFAVLFLDIDRFKMINDSLGHAIGDDLLVSMAKRIQATLRPGDTVARCGGDDFVCLMEDIQSQADAEQMTQKLQRILALPHALGGHEVFASASFGITLGGGDPQEKPEDIIRNAEIAMYRAKAQGRGRFAVYDEGMHKRVASLLHLEIDLRRALRRNEFFLHYQPIVRLAGRQIVGFEVLLRWRHPKRGLVPPEDFISVAEETGLIVPIGQWVLGEVCQQTKSWRERLGPTLPFSISVNMSARHFSEPDLFNQVSEMLQSTGCDPSTLILEITESEIMESPDILMPALEELKKLHIQLHVDDFGTGYSSLSYLQRFPIDKLKIDRSFVAGLGTTNENAEIVSAIIQLAHNLRMGVIAEGVETERQAAYLEALQCEFAQGNHFHAPCDAAAAARLIGADTE